MSSDGKPKLNLLVAYPYMKKEILNEIDSLVRDGYCRFLLDSGAFSCDTLGIKITVDDYCRFLDELPVKPWRYFMLDVVGDPDGTLRNYEIMLKRGYRPIPVFTRGSDWQIIEEYYKTADCVALGGLVSMPLTKKRQFISTAMRHIKGRKVHWLGVTSDDLIKHFRPYSCDSSGVASAERFATMKLYIGNGKSLTIGKDGFRKRPDNTVLQVIRGWGFDPKALAQSNNWINSSKQSCLHIQVSFHSHVAKMLDFEKHTGTRIFMAICNEYQAIASTQAFRKIAKVKEVTVSNKWF